MEGTTIALISFLIFTLMLIGDFNSVEGQFLNGIPPATSFLNAPGRILGHITPIRNLPFQSPYSYQNTNSFGLPANYRTSYRAPEEPTPGCSCHLFNADFPPLMNAFSRNTPGPIYGNNQPYPQYTRSGSSLWGYGDYPGTTIN